jgi:hypothetical protein
LGSTFLNAIRIPTCPESTLGRLPVLSYADDVISFLRFIGLLNLAIWLGASVFFTFVGGPAFFSDEMMKVLQHRYYAGAAAEVVMGRYFILNYCCAAVALAHLLAVRLYSGRRLSRSKLGLWIVLAGLILFGGLQLQPQLRMLHHTMYWGETATQQSEAARSFRIWHGASQMVNLLVLGGLVVYFSRVVRPEEPPRYATGAAKIQGLTN